jgi:hypothetical protein
MARRAGIDQPCRLVSAGVRRQHVGRARALLIRRGACNPAVGGIRPRAHLQLSGKARFRLGLDACGHDAAGGRSTAAACPRPQGGAPARCFSLSSAISRFGWPRAWFSSLSGSQRYRSCPCRCRGSALLWRLVWRGRFRRCLNRCHRRPQLAAFGVAADRDAFNFGLTNGASCAGACWTLMLPMLLAGRGWAALRHDRRTLFVFAERLERPAPLAWRWRGTGKAWRIVLAQAQTVRVSFTADPAAKL